ncbi:MAG: porin [Polyangiaceae bacterium]|nr:porin [Polyangiaceae bacterium]
MNGSVSSRTQCGFAVALACFGLLEGAARAQSPESDGGTLDGAPPPPLPTTPPPGTAVSPEAASPAALPPAVAVPEPTLLSVPSVPPPAAPEQQEKAADPFAFGDFTWLNGSNRQHKALLDSEIFTGSFLIDVNYTASQNNPIDNTVVGSTALSRNNEITLAFLGFGGDFHYKNTRGRLMTQFGNRSTLVPRNDFSTFRGQFDLQTALRYISEAYGGYHWDVLHGINLDGGIFMSYVGLFSYDNFENWMYLPSFTSDNTPWFFNGLRLQIFPTDTLKIEPWIINGWQSYGKFNEMPGFGFQILWRPVEWFSVLSNGYAGWDTQDTPGRLRFHSDNSVQVRYYNAPGHVFDKAAFSITGDVGGEQGDGVTPFGGSGKEHGCTTNTPCTQQFLSWMAYHRLSFFDDHFAWTVGGGQMHNPGRYLVLSPTGNASAIPQPLSIQGIQYSSPSSTFDLSPGTQFDAWDYETGVQYMPNEQITYDLEFNHRQASVPYFAGHGGVTSPDGYITTPTPAGWRPDLVKGDTRLIAALLVRF